MKNTLDITGLVLVVALLLPIAHGCGGTKKYTYDETKPKNFGEDKENNDDSAFKSGDKAFSRAKRLSNLEKVYSSTFDFTQDWMKECWEDEKMPEIFGNWVLGHVQKESKCVEEPGLENFKHKVLVEQKGTCFRFKDKTANIGVSCQTNRKTQATYCTGRRFGKGENLVAEIKIQGRFNNGKWKGEYTSILAGKKRCETSGVFVFMEKLKSEAK